MPSSLHAGIALTALASVVAMTAPVSAADLGGMRGSIKDEYVHAAPVSVGSCYARADVGYAFSGDPEISWAQTDGDPASPTFGNHLGDEVETLNFDDAWFGAVGAGCGFGKGGGRGIRAEVMFGYHGKRKIDGEPEHPWNPPGVPLEDPMHTDITSYSAMVNIYKDLGTYGRFTPYIGAGVGLAYNITNEVYFTDNPFLVNRIEGDRDIALAWAVMAGVGIQVTDRTTLDIGYRYLDLGKANSGQIDNAFFPNPQVNIDDLTSHELKVGLRYAFGGGDCCSAAEYIPVK